MKKIPLALTIIVSGIVAFSFSPLSKDLKKTYDEYWENKYWEKENPRREAQRLKEIEEFEANNHVREYKENIAGTKIEAQIKIKPKDKYSCYVSLRIEPFPKTERPEDAGLVFNVYDSDGFSLYRNDYLNRLKSFTRLVNNSGEVGGAEKQYVIHESISLFEENNISIGSYGGASEFLKTAEQFIKPKAKPVSKNTQWQAVSIPNICTYKIPPTLEIQDGNYKRLSKDFREQVLKIKLSPNRVVAQPSGINSMNSAIKKYCRVIVETELGKTGDYQGLHEPMIASPQELLQIGENLKKELEKSFSANSIMKMKLLDWEPVSIIKLNGVDALASCYTRSLNGGKPVTVNQYRIMNNDSLHTITLSYRLTEQKLWFDDLQKTLETFVFVKR